jgi:hypothetical protein
MATACDLDNPRWRGEAGRRFGFARRTEVNSIRLVKRLLVYDLSALAAVYGLWVCGWYKESWMDVIGWGFPWLWLGVFYVSSYVALHKRVSWAPLKSLVAALFTLTTFWILCLLTMPIFDPMW